MYFFYVGAYKYSASTKLISLSHMPKYHELYLINIFGAVFEYFSYFSHGKRPIKL